MDDKTNKRYDSALNILFYEGQIGWQMNIVFLAINAGLIALIVPCINNWNKIGFDFLGLFIGIGGIIISIKWFFTFRRNARYYHFRMAQAREAEPGKWSLLNDRGYRFSKGERIEIPAGVDKDKYPKDIEHKLDKWEEKAKNKEAMEIVIFASIVLYSFFSFASLCIIFFYFKILKMVDWSSNILSGLVPSFISVIVTSVILWWAYQKQFKIFREQINEQRRQIDSQILIASNQSSMEMILELDRVFSASKLTKIRISTAKKILSGILAKHDFDYSRDLSEIEYIYDFFCTVSYFIKRAYVNAQDAWHFFDSWFSPYYEFYVTNGIKELSGREVTVWSDLEELKLIFDKIEFERGGERDRKTTSEELHSFFEEERDL